MFRKINLRILVYIFGALLVFAIISQIWEKKKGDRTFRSELALFDTSRATSVVISDLKSGKSSLELTKTGNTWKMKSGDKEYRTDRESITSLLRGLTEMKAERIAASGKEKWKEFEVTDSLALRITVKNKRKILADLMVGRFSWQPSNNPYDRQGNMTTYVRPAGEKEVYAVNGFVRMGISPDVSRFRDKTVVKANSGGLKKLTFQYPADSSFVLEKQGNAWVIQGLPVDSAKAAAYLSSLGNLSGDAFLDEGPTTGQALFKLITEGGSAVPIEITAFAADSTEKYMITSSQNPDTRFSGRSGLADRIFKSKEAFIGLPAKQE